jgi:hypothetical protein
VPRLCFDDEKIMSEYAHTSHRIPTIWAGLLVDRNNLPCVGEPIQDEDETEDEPVVEEPLPPREAKLKVGDTVGRWLLKKYAPGAKNSHSQWFCYCTCGCGTERWVRASNLNTGRSTSCTRGRKKK